MTRLQRSELAALGALLALAAALRLVGIRYGLPYPFLNPDEASIVPRAWQIAHGHGLDPGWYEYPSFLMYLLAPVQAFFHTPSYGAGRAVAVAIGLGGVAGAWWLGRRAYGGGAGIVAAATVAVATTEVAYSRAAVTDGLLALGVTCALALMLAGRLEWAGLAVGLAAATKYPGALLLVPLAVAGWGNRRRSARAAALAVAGFALATPFVLVHAGHAWHDIARITRLARDGWLGFEHDPPAPIAFLDRLWQALGPLLALALAGLAVALWRRRRADLVLASFALVYWLTLLPQRAHFDRYVLPLVPVLGVLAGRVRRAVPAALALLLVPLAWSIGDARGLTRTDTRLAALPLVERLVPPGATIAADPSTLLPPGRKVLALRLPGPGRRPDPRRDLAVLRRAGVAYVLVGGAVTDRVLAAPARYPREVRFYEVLARQRPLLDVEPGHGLAGPWVRLYRLRG